MRCPRVCGRATQLPEPIFTPATKAQSGHDENISFDKTCDIVGLDTGEPPARSDAEDLPQSRRATRATRGIIIADTKFEFGLIGDELVLADEVLTPDSSRFWPVETYKPGGPQPSYDKQYVRDYLESIHWNKQPPAPRCPAKSPAAPAKNTKKRFAH